MNTAILGLAFDVIVAALLGVTIHFCWRLQQRIRVLQDSRSELAALITKFDASTERAKSSIHDIQTASRLITESMQTKLEKANYLADDLSFLIEKAGKLTQGEGPRAAFKEAPAATAATAARAQTTPSQPSTAVGKPVRSKAEQELLDALKSR